MTSQAVPGNRTITHRKKPKDDLSMSDRNIRIYSQIDASGCNEVAAVVDDDLIEVDGVSVQNRLVVTDLSAEETRRILRWNISMCFKLRVTTIHIPLRFKFAANVCMFFLAQDEFVEFFLLQSIHWIQKMKKTWIIVLQEFFLLKQRFLCNCQLKNYFCHNTKYKLCFPQF